MRSINESLEPCRQKAQRRLCYRHSFKFAVTGITLFLNVVFFEKINIVSAFVALPIGKRMVISNNNFCITSFNNQQHRSMIMKLSESSFDGSDVDMNMDLLNQRIDEVKLSVLEEEMYRPPNPKLAPYEVVDEIMHGLQNLDDPIPNSGLRLLIRASTPEWRRAMFKAIGAPIPMYAKDEDLVVSAMREAMGRPNNQFGVLIGADDDIDDYTINFVNEDKTPMAFQNNDDDDLCDIDGFDCSTRTKIYLECEIRNEDDDALLAIMGWQLNKRPIDGSWLVHRIDWQDFRWPYHSQRITHMRDALERWSLL